jgi:hypothetical protein
MAQNIIFIEIYNILNVHTFCCDEYLNNYVGKYDSVQQLVTGFARVFLHQP